MNGCAEETGKAGGDSLKWLRCREVFEDRTSSDEITWEFYSVGRPRVTSRKGGFGGRG